jgi:hypothetical protein
MDPVTEALLSVEYPALLLRGERADWDCKLDGLNLVVRMIHANGRDCFELRGDLTDYNRVPPAWLFAEPDTGLVGTYRAFPARPSVFGGVTPAFTEFEQRPGVKVPVICLPCNRLCYKEYAGINGDWTLASNWMDRSPSCTTLASSRQVDAGIVTSCNSDTKRASTPVSLEKRSTSWAIKSRN